MNSYNPYSGNRKKIFRNILTVLIAAVIIFSATVIWGNALRKKAESTADTDLAGIGRDDVIGNSPIVVPPAGEGTVVSPSVTGVCVPLGMGTPLPAEDGTEEDAEGGYADPYGSSFDDRLEAAALSGDAVLIPLTDEGGYLLYNSPGVGEFSRLPENPSLPTISVLAASVERANALGLRTVAYISAGVDVDADATVLDKAISTDRVIVRDAAEAGFDEIIVRSPVSSAAEFTGEHVTVMLKYLTALTASSGDMQVGFALPPQVYTELTLSPRIELLMSSSVFLAMELEPEISTAEYAQSVTDSLSGTLSVYNMRILMSPATDRIHHSMIQVLQDAGHSNYLTLTVPETDDSPIPDETDAPDVPDVPEVTEVTEVQTQEVTTAPPVVTDPPETIAPPAVTETETTVGVVTEPPAPPATEEVTDTAVQQTDAPPTDTAEAQV